MILKTSGHGTASLGKRQGYHHGDLRAALMNAALSLIDKHGVQGFSLKDAALMAGVSTAAPYRHFADKEALIDEIQTEGFELFNAALSAAYERRATPSERIEELGVAYVLFALHHPAHFKVMFGLRKTGEGAVDRNVGNMDTNDESSGFMLLVAAVNSLHPKADVEAQNDRVIACWSVVHGFALLQMEGVLAATIGKIEPEAQLRRTLRQMVEGIAKQSESSL